MDTNNLVLTSHKEGVTTLTMNNPKRLNGWTMEMMDALRYAMQDAAKDEDTRVLIVTGTDPYYCAGVNLGKVIQPQHPKVLHAFIEGQNRRLFEMFLRFPKPILIAANGPAIGASVTSATLCDGIIASEKATFSTPFHALSVPAEGCSSMLFPRILGQEATDRMFGPEAWKPTGEEAKEIGLVQWVVPHESLMDEAHRIAQDWIQEGRTRTYPDGTTLDELIAVNARESKEIADAFLDVPFLQGQFRFLWSKKKYGPALVFFALQYTRPLWSLLL